jgi:hypothetical protein
MDTTRYASMPVSLIRFSSTYSDALPRKPTP